MFRRKTILELGPRALVGAIGYLLISAALGFHKSAYSDVLGVIFGVLGIQFLAWALGVRSEFLGTANVTSSSRAVLERKISDEEELDPVRAFDLVVADAESSSAYLRDSESPIIPQLVIAYEENNSSVTELLKVSAQVESSVFALYERLSKEMTPASPAMAINDLLDAKLVTPKVAYAFKVFWVMRKSIVHEQQVLSKDQLRSLVYIANRLRLLLGAPTFPYPAIKDLT